MKWMLSVERKLDDSCVHLALTRRYRLLKYAILLRRLYWLIGLKKKWVVTYCKTCGFAWEQQAMVRRWTGQVYYLKEPFCKRCKSRRTEERKEIGRAHV